MILEINVMSYTKIPDIIKLRFLDSSKLVLQQIHI